MLRSTAATTETPGSTIAPPPLRRVGFALAALLAIADVVVGIVQGADHTLPSELSVGLVIAGVMTWAAIPWGWRGRVWAIRVVIGVRLLSALTAVPAFFMEDVTSDLIVTAAGIILVTAVTVVLLTYRTGRSGK